MTSHLDNAHQSKDIESKNKERSFEDVRKHYDFLGKIWNGNKKLIDGKWYVQISDVCNSIEDK